MQSFLIQLMNGLSYAFLLFILASGLSLMFGLMRIVNMAHGSYYLFGAYVGYTVSKATGNFFIAVVAGAVSVTVIGLLMERFLFRLLYKQELEQVLLTFGFIYIFADVCKWIWGGSILSIAKPAILAPSVNLFHVTFPTYRLGIIIIGLVIAVALWYFHERTRIGAIIRAGVDDREMVSGLGINVGTYFTLIFALGAALAGLGGVIGGPFISIYPGLDLQILILALIVVVIGGLGSLTGAFLGSILIGLADTFGKAYLPQFAMFTIFAVMALVLIFRPSGLLGRKE